MNRARTRKKTPHMQRATSFRKAKLRKRPKTVKKRRIVRKFKAENENDTIQKVLLMTTRLDEIHEKNKELNALNFKLRNELLAQSKRQSLSNIDEDEILRIKRESKKYKRTSDELKKRVSQKDDKIDKLKHEIEILQAQICEQKVEMHKEHIIKHQVIDELGKMQNTGMHVVGIKELKKALMGKDNGIELLSKRDSGEEIPLVRMSAEEISGIASEFIQNQFRDSEHIRSSVSTELRRWLKKDFAE